MKIMLAWDSMPDDKTTPKEQGARFGGLLYQLTVVFPSWAGAIIVLYSILQLSLGFLKIRPR